MFYFYGYRFFTDHTIFKLKGFLTSSFWAMAINGISSSLNVWLVLLWRYEENFMEKFQKTFDNLFPNSLAQMELLKRCIYLIWGLIAFYMKNMYAVKKKYYTSKSNVKNTLKYAANHFNTKPDIHFSWFCPIWLVISCVNDLFLYSLHIFSVN